MKIVKRLTAIFEIQSIEIVATDQSRKKMNKKFK